MVWLNLHFVKITLVAVRRKDWKTPRDNPRKTYWELIRISQARDDASAEGAGSEAGVEEKRLKRSLGGKTEQSLMMERTW